MVELLSPAGDIEKLKIAVQNGADAIYMAGKKFGARAFSKNFEDDEILDAIKYCHLYGVKLYITINTIVYEDEVEEFIDYVEFLYKNNVDAVIIQDLGMADLIHKKFPDLTLHASTQMNIHDISGLKLLKEMGFKRVVLAREVDLETIKQMKKEVDIELEVFIHGALCISCSGNCYYSYFEMNRSGNRGMCAQLCRQPYKLYKEDNEIKLEDKYLLSPKDLCTVKKLDELIDAGIDSFKIEGRMKSKEYVGLVTRVYRNKIDYNKVSDKDINNIKKVFNRGFTLGNLYNQKGHEFINGYKPNHMGVLVGEVIGSSKGKVKIKLSDDINQEDAIRFVLDNEIGFYLNRIYKNNLLVNGAKQGEIIEVDCKEKIPINTKVYKTIDTKLNDYIISSSNNIRKVTLDGIFNIDGNDIIFEVTDKINKEKIVLKESVFEAKNKPTTEYEIREKLNKLGNEIYVFNDLKININDNIFIPMTTINNLRRNMIELINNDRLKNINHKICNYKFNKVDINITNDIFFEVKNEEQLKYILDNTNYKIYIEDEKLYNQYKQERVIFKQTRLKHNDKENVLISDIDNINKNVITDAYLNVVNSYYVRFLLERGIKKVTLSYELNNYQIKDIVDSYNDRYKDKANLEVIVYGKPEIMISKYNMLNTYNLDDGRYYLVDKFNKKFPLIIKEDYMRLYNHESINKLEDIDELINIGITNFKIVLDNENKEDIKMILNALKVAKNIL
ncbi:MAG: U32 family peptidase [Bacilli bacterium]|nr:U32 family peptidase [Bacilli bacterium]MBO6194815.1 U32 family peptidase [Bacilli bacterium]